MTTKKTYHKPIPPRHTETPDQREASIKALVDGYIAKGGPITKEQIKVLDRDEVHYPRYFELSSSGEIQELRMSRDFPMLSVVETKHAFWRKDDAEHAKLLEDGKRQMTPITPEQAKLLRVGDVYYAATRHADVVEMDFTRIISTTLIFDAA